MSKLAQYCPNCNRQAEIKVLRINHETFTGSVACPHHCHIETASGKDSYEAMNRAIARWVLYCRNFRS